MDSSVRKSHRRMAPPSIHDPPRAMSSRSDMRAASIIRRTRDPSIRSENIPVRVVNRRADNNAMLSNKRRISQPMQAGSVQKKTQHIPRAASSMLPPGLIRSEALRHVRRLAKRKQAPFCRSLIAPSDEVIQRRISALKRAGKPPLPYQEIAAKWLAEGTYRLLFDGMGLGKTLEALLALPEPEVAGSLVICPASVRTGWQREIQMWREDLTPIVIKSPRFFRWPEQNEIVVVGWDGLPKSFKEQPPCPFALILDEIHFGKNPDSRRSQLAYPIAVLANMIFGLTGTPMPNNPEDLHQVYTLAGMGRLLGPQMDFPKAFFDFTGGNRIADAAHGELMEIMNLTALRRTGRDVSDQLPPIRIKRVDVSIGDANVRDIDALMRHLGGDQKLAQLLDKLEIAANLRVTGSHQREHLSQMRDELCMAKIPELYKLVNEFKENGEPVVVYSPFRGVIDVLEERGWAVIHGGMSDAKKRIVTDSFNSGYVRYLAISDAAGTGINLQGPENLPCVNMIRVGLSFSPAVNNQVVKRIDRAASRLSRMERTGKPKPILIHDLVADNTRADIIVYNVLIAKNSLLDCMGLAMDIRKAQ